MILWPDTFNNHFHPQTAKAAVDVLESAGFRVIIPGKSLCCGRPLYDFGMLETAKGMLARGARDTSSGDRGRHSRGGPRAELRRGLPR